VSAVAAWVEASALGGFARGSAWGYAAASILHVLGAATLLGSILVYDLRLLRGALPEPRPALWLARSGAALAACTGPVLFAADATHLIHNPAFQAKAALLALAVGNIVAAHTIRPRVQRAAAILSLLLWPVVIACGRLIAYL